MLARTLPVLGAALALTSCGYIGLELRDLPIQGDGSVDADAGALDASLTDAAAQRDAIVADGGDAGALVGDAGVGDAGGGDAGASEAGASDAGASDAALADASVGSDAGLTACDLGGSWAVKITTAVSWPGGLLQAGAGTATTWLLYDGTQGGASWTGTAQACGFTLPDFALNPVLAAETYALRVPDTLFDHEPPYIAPVAASIAISGSGAAGSSLTLSSQAFVIGTTLANPQTDAWPSAGSGVVLQTDHDLDMLPGVTTTYPLDATHLYPPLDVGRTLRADVGYSALRLVFSGTGTVTSCSQLDGNVTFSHFETHILGCHVAGGSTCTDTQRDFIDANRPLHSAGGSTYQAIKVPANTTCSQIRSTLLP